MLKEIIHSSVLYIIPLNSKTDMEPVKTNESLTISAMVGKSLVVTGSSKEKNGNVKLVSNLFQPTSLENIKVYVLKKASKLVSPGKLQLIKFKVSFAPMLYKWSGYINVELYKNSFKKFFLFN